jgi:hypothetical protein
MTRTLKRLLITAFILAFGVAFITGMRDGNEIADNQLTLAEKKAVTMRTCFPEGIYRADAASTCPAFKAMLVDEMNQNEAGEGQ